MLSTAAVLSAAAAVVAAIAAAVVAAAAVVVAAAEVLAAAVVETAASALTPHPPNRPVATTERLTTADSETGGVKFLYSFYVGTSLICYYVCLTA